MKLIDADIARCPGTGEPPCWDCARRLQLEQDDKNKWYPMMSPQIVNGVCRFKIEVKKDEAV